MLQLKKASTHRPTTNAKVSHGLGTVSETALATPVASLSLLTIFAMPGSVSLDYLVEGRRYCCDTCLGFPVTEISVAPGGDSFRCRDCRSDDCKSYAQWHKAEFEMWKACKLKCTNGNCIWVGPPTKIEQHVRKCNELASLRDKLDQARMDRALDSEIASMKRRVAEMSTTAPETSCPACDWTGKAADIVSHFSDCVKRLQAQHDAELESRSEQLASLATALSNCENRLREKESALVMKETEVLLLTRRLLDLTERELAVLRGALIVDLNVKEEDDVPDPKRRRRA